MDALQDRKERVSIAKYKWTNAQTLLKHAVVQLTDATTLWEKINTVSAK